MTRYGLTPAQYPDFAALRGDPSDNLPSIPGVGEKTAAKWVREFGSLEALTDRVDEVKGKAGDALRAHLAHVLLNRQLTELIRDVPLDAAPDDLVARPWDREAVHRLFDELEFRVLRERLFATLTSAEPEAEEGFDVEGGALEPGTVRAWLDAHARDGRRVGIAVHGRLATWAGRDVDGIALAAGEPSLEARAAGASAGAAQAAYLDVRTLAAGRRGGAGGVAGRRVRAQGGARRQGGAARPARPRLGPQRADQRHRAGRVPGPAGAAQLRPRRPRAALPAPRAARRERAGERPAVPARRRGGGRRRTRAGADRRRLGGGRAGRRAGRRAGPARGHAAARRAGAAVAGRAGRPGDRRRRRRPRGPRRAGGRVRRAGQAGRAGRVRRDRQGDQPRVAEAAAGGAVRRAEHAQDQAHQDRLHHRRRRAADAVRADRAPVPVAPAGAPRRDAAQGHRRGAAQVDRRRRAHPHHLQPDDRRHRPAVVDGAEPAERAHPHGGGAADPRHLRRRRRRSPS